MGGELVKTKFGTLIFMIMIAWGSCSWAAEGAESKNEPVMVFAGMKKGLTPFPDDEATRKIIKQTNIEKEAMRLEKLGHFDEAISKYKEAMAPELLNSERDKSGGMHGIIRIHQKKGEFDLALNKLEWFSTYPNQLYIDLKPELEALIKARDTGSNEPIYAHIEYLKNKYKKWLPPKEHNSLYASYLIRLYDYVGDVDAGLKFVESVLSSKKLHSRARTEYEKVKQAFLEDKANGSKGRATNALTQSTYFSW
jgi:hypothetical protein